MRTDNVVFKLNFLWNRSAIYFFFRSSISLKYQEQFLYYQPIRYYFWRTFLNTWRFGSKNLNCSSSLVIILASLILALKALQHPCVIIVLIEVDYFNSLSFQLDSHHLHHRWNIMIVIVYFIHHRWCITNILQVVAP